MIQSPGVALLYGGMVHKGIAMTLFLQSLTNMGIISLWWWLIGFSLCFGKSGGVVGSPGSYPALTNVSQNILEINGSPSVHIAGFTFVIFQLQFAIITPTLMTGGFIERMRYRAFMPFILLWVTLVYAPFAHLSWGGGLFFQWGVYDYAGGTVVHLTSGWSALASTLFLGLRDIPDDAPPRNVPHILLGTALLWFGWFGFNGGSALMANGQASAACLNSQLAAASAMCTWVVIDWVQRGKPYLTGACCGAITGLVTITPLAGYCQPWAAVVTGCLGALGSQAMCTVRKKFLVAYLDDTLDVWGIHGIAGFVGSVLVGILSDPSECAPPVGIPVPSWCASTYGVTRSGTQFGKQLAASLICASYSFGMTLLILKLLSLVMGVRPPPRQRTKFRSEAWSSSQSMGVIPNSPHNKKTKTSAGQKLGLGSMPEGKAVNFDDGKSRAMDVSDLN